MNSFHDGPRLSVDLDAIARNYRLLRNRLNGAACAAVVKADAYGLGAIPVASRLLKEGCKTFFVATLDEAVSLKTHIGDAQIFVFHGVQKDEGKDFVAFGILPVLNDREQLQRWKDIANGLPAALHIDTGMCRLGLDMVEAEKLSRDEIVLNALNIQFIMSHLACAGETDHPMNAKQLAKAKQLKTWFPHVPLSLANSSGIFLSPDFHFDLARPGCALYGITPNESLPNPMENVVELSAPILQIRTLEKDTAVGYGATITAPKGTKIATIAFGYADGMLRSLGNNAVAHISGAEARVLGRVSMDMIMLDVSTIPERLLQEGARAVLIGPDQPVDMVAARAGTIGYEVFTRLGNRVARGYTGSA